MELLTITLAANQTQQFAKSGRYFEIIDSSYAVRVDFIGDQGQQTDSMVNALSGLFIEDPFAAFAITNGSVAQSITFLLLEAGRGGSRRQPGIVSVSNKLGAGITQLEVSAGLLTIGFLTVSVIAAASNLRGILVRKVSTSATAGAGQADIGLIAAPVVPTSTVPLNGFNMSRVAPTGSSVSAVDARNDMNYQLPAGWGVWAVTQHSVAPAAAGYTFTYELL